MQSMKGGKIRRHLTLLFLAEPPGLLGSSNPASSSTTRAITISARSDCQSYHKTYLGTRHHAWQVVVCSERRFVRLTDNGEWRVEATETIDRQFGSTSDAAVY